MRRRLTLVGQYLRYWMETPIYYRIVAGFFLVFGWYNAVRADSDSTCIMCVGTALAILLVARE